MCVTMMFDWQTDQQLISTSSLSQILTFPEKSIVNQSSIDVAAPAPETEQQFVLNVSQQTIDERLMFRHRRV